MRLINAETVQVQEFPSDESVPAFAILSHTWSDQECTFRDIEAANVKDRTGYAKIKRCCRQALENGLQWVWVNT